MYSILFMMDFVENYIFQKLMRFKKCINIVFKFQF